MSDAVRGDRAVRAMTGDESFRVIAAVTTATVRGAATAQGANGDAAARLGETMTGAILLREAMSPNHRLQIVLRDVGGGTVVADALPDGATRGMVNPGYSYEKLDVGAEAQLQVARTLANGELHQGIVAVPANGTMSTAIMRYLQDSEQVFSVVAVASLVDGDDVTAAGGYLVQLLPDALAVDLAEMTDKLADLPPLDELLREADDDADAVLRRVLADIDHTRLGESAVRFGCNCSRERFIAGLATIERSELADMLAAGKPLEIRCEACGRHYEINPRELAPLLR